MTTYTFQKRVVVIRSADGRYWSEISPDGPPWVDSIDRASLHDPRYVTKPEDVTYMGNTADRRELKASKLLPVTVTTVYEVGE